jgi:hypothetical protein
MDSSRNFWSIHVIIFVTSPCPILPVDLLRGTKNLTQQLNRAASSNVQKVFEIKFGWDSTMSFG